MSKYTHLKEAAEAATPGPWSVSEHTVRGDLCMNAGAGWIFELYAMIDTHPEPDVIEALQKDAAFIAAANPKVVLELLADLERVRGENEVQREQLEIFKEATSDIELEEFRAWKPVNGTEEDELRHEVWTTAADIMREAFEAAARVLGESDHG